MKSKLQSMKLLPVSLSNALALVASLFWLTGCASSPEPTMDDKSLQILYSPYVKYNTDLHRDETNLRIHHVPESTLRGFYEDNGHLLQFEALIASRRVGVTKSDFEQGVCDIYVLKPTQATMRLDSEVLGHELMHCFVKNFHFVDMQLWYKQGMKGAQAVRISE